MSKLISSLPMSNMVYLLVSMMLQEPGEVITNEDYANNNVHSNYNIIHLVTSLKRLS